MLSMLLMSFVGISQDVKLVNCEGEKGFLVPRTKMEYFFKLVQINELLETRKSECDTLVTSLERENLILERKALTADRIISEQKKTLDTKDGLIADKDRQLLNCNGIITLQSKKIKDLSEENRDLKESVDKEKQKKKWWGAGGFAAGVGICLFFLL